MVFILGGEESLMVGVIRWSKLLVAGAEKDAMVEGPEDMRGPGSALGQLEFLFDMRRVLIYDD
jgi:hypothetical protein